MQYFVGGDLPGEGFRQLGVPGLELPEQAHVLDGDDRLVGKSLQQRDLLIGEWIYFGPSQRDRPNRRSLPQQRNGQSRPIAEFPCEGTVSGELLLFSLHVSKMNGPPLQDGAARDG